MENLEKLSAKELKIIATSRGLAFNPTASAQNMLKILEGSNDPEETPEDDKDLADKEDEEDEETSDNIDTDGFVFEVVTPIKKGGIFYKKGSKISFEEKTQEVELLLKDNIIK